MEVKSGGLKEVSAYIIWYRVHTWGLQGKGKVIFCALPCIFTKSIHVNVKNSTAEGTCLFTNKGHFSSPLWI